ncbi:MAG: signal recognition particle-docking protein FtsY [Alphaproteobacteria bacterium]|nr:signal recognition particle-docking protein FtsY [Alphaproteobacteria bacterium]
MALGWLTRLKEGLTRSSTRLAEGIAEIVTKRAFDPAAIDQIEELLVGADLGVQVAARLAESLRRRRFDKGTTADHVREALAEEIAAVLAPVARPLALAGGHRPQVILVVGVNGNGKTTTIGKLAKQFQDAGKSVLIAAGDTFRAAAIDQLRIWGERAGTPVIAGEPGADASGLAYDALAQARSRGADVLLIDTAGRLQNKAGLMAELQKMVRVLAKLDATAPHNCVLVLDATTGQNAHSQVETFQSMVGVNGLILTKLDGTARGGVVVALAERFKLPIHAVGVGEGIEDLRPFAARDFARALLGLKA